MATGTIKSLKHKDVSINISNGSTFNGTSSGVDYSRIVGAFMIYTDAIYYQQAVFAIDTSGTVNVKLASNATAAREYKVRVFYY